MSRATAVRSAGSFSPIETLEPRRLLSAGHVTDFSPIDWTGSSLHVQSSSTTVAARQVTVELRAFHGSVRVGSNFYAKVTAEEGTPRGLVYFYANGEPIGAGWVVDGEAWMHTKQLPGGNHSVYAVYTGDPLHDRAGSNEITHQVKTAAAPLAKAVFGRWDWRGNGPVQVYGHYAPSAVIVATGTLTFHDKPTLGGSTWQATAPLDALGRADFGMITPPADLQFLYYTYSGDANYPAESNLIYIPQPYTAGNPAPTSIRISAHQSATNVGEPITLTALLQRPTDHTLSAAYSGIVDFWHEEMFLGSATVDASGIATLVATGPDTGGNHTITGEGLHLIRAVFYGDATHAPAMAQTWHAVLPSARLSRTTLTADRITATQNQPITFIATVTDAFGNSAGDLPGLVKLLDEWGKPIGPGVGVAADGTATFHIYELPADVYGISAAYQGTLGHNGYTPSQSPEMPISFTPRTVTLSTRPELTARLFSTTTERYPASLVVTLAGNNPAVKPTGKIALYSQYDGNLFLGYVDIAADGTATTSFAPGLSKFYQKVRVIYLGDSNHSPTEAVFPLIPTYSYLNASPVNDLPAGATLAFSADVNGDSINDLVYRDLDTGAVILRFMNAAGQPIGGKTLPSAPLDKWALDAGGDVDGDGVADLVWRNLASSRAYIWFLDSSGSLKDQGFINSGGTAAGWRVVATGDFNRDGRDDIVWSNDLTGQRAVWLLNGRNVRSVAMFNHAPRDTAWIIQSIEDLDGDGNADLLWRNTRTEATYAWLLRGTSIIGTAAHTA